MGDINVYSVFSSFCTNLEIPQSVENIVDTRIRTIAKRINAKIKAIQKMVGMKVPTIPFA